MCSALQKQNVLMLLPESKFDQTFAAPCLGRSGLSRSPGVDPGLAVLDAAPLGVHREIACSPGHSSSIPPVFPAAPGC